MGNVNNSTVANTNPNPRIAKFLLTLVLVTALVAIVFLARGFFIYYRGRSALVQLSRSEIERFIATRHPPVTVAVNLRRIETAVPQNYSWRAMNITNCVLCVLHIGSLTNNQMTMISEAAKLVEQKELSEREMKIFIAKYENDIPPWKSQ